ncbi:LLM class F420-dependent oxidoreductase [Mycobacterium sp. CVI_P3]|uniref:LLM class F420-dependent oxidoreductase n=1 Tax=Mycobacterium pinniadriaticum TaxID=2994102 RepID=A0ABT3SIK6_9MYCO|nr:LLM class F420-dependent oxidoreductase [Mycobacterium pinniadriaticum]MCX2932969.1 LLM class F420-dependent oxidoreductase [Mycobacterium pinniadriaticum]MCX2939359.1 LLM class F420-dependent oxidoreductase [Mycobacterium pinniadriaticum]
MRIGLSTPMVMQLPGVSSEWENNAGVADLAHIAHTADELGFDHLTCAEHIAVPVDEGAQRGLTYWDPLSTFGFLAAHTSRISLTTSVIVLGYHHPLEIAKRFGTLDRLSEGRLVLGVGVGSLAEEFDLLGATFDGRGERADDAIRALRASLSTTRPAYQGSHYQFGGFAVQPCAVQPRVPIWVGGRTLRSLRRAVRLADGWIPFGLNTAEIEAMLSAVDAPPGFDIVLSTGHAVDPVAEPTRTTKRLRALHDAGATAITASVTADSPAHYCDQLAALRELADEL